MGSSAIDIEEFEVVQKVDRERETVLLMDRKETTALVQNIGAQELKKKGANDVAGRRGRSWGLSVVGDRYLMVRGMGFIVKRRLPGTACRCPRRTRMPRWPCWTSSHGHREQPVGEQGLHPGTVAW